MQLPLFVANWKMNKTAEQVGAFLTSFPAKILDVVPAKAEVVIAPQAMHLAQVFGAMRSHSVTVAAQNCGQAEWGAYTGENSPVALKDLGVQWVILGHSERRWVFGENDVLILERLKAALKAGLKPILCIGERIEDRREKRTFQVLQEQLEILKGLSGLENLTVAYEPVWAIGTGETATPAQAQEAHAYVRGWLKDSLGAKTEGLRILYGGSAKPDNAGALMAQKDVDGLLVGGASLEALGFAELVRNGVRSQP